MRDMMLHLSDLYIQCYFEKNSKSRFTPLMNLSALKRAIRPFSTMSSHIDSAVASVLKIDPSNATLAGTGGGGCSSASASKIKATMPDGYEK
jgi:hypothetical protein